MARVKMWCEKCNMETIHCDFDGKWYCTNHQRIIVLDKDVVDDIMRRKGGTKQQ